MKQARQLSIAAWQRLKKRWDAALEFVVDVLDDDDIFGLVDACLDLYAANEKFAVVWAAQGPVEPPVGGAADPRMFEVAKRAVKLGEYLNRYAQVDAPEETDPEELKGLVCDLVLVYRSPESPFLRPAG
jgi:hypothetical protein